MSRPTFLGGGARSAPPLLLTQRMRGTLRVPYALAILLLRVLTEVLQLQYR